MIPYINHKRNCPHCKVLHYGFLFQQIYSWEPFWFRGKIESDKFPRTLDDFRIPPSSSSIFFGNGMGTQLECCQRIPSLAEVTPPSELDSKWTSTEEICTAENVRGEIKPLNPHQHHHHSLHTYRYTDSYKITDSWMAFGMSANGNTRSFGES